jgi:hypothetical protein
MNRRIKKNNSLGAVVFRSVNNFKRQRRVRTAKKRVKTIAGVCAKEML